MKKSITYAFAAIVGLSWTSGSEANAQTDITNQGGRVTAKYYDSPAGEEVGKLFDNFFNSKYLTFHPEGWVVFEAKRAATAVTYSITSGNDAPERDPKDWIVQGSNDARGWYTIDRRTNQDFPRRGDKRSFTIDYPGNYKYYKLEAKNNSGNTLQLAEWDIYASGGPTNPDPDPDPDGGWDRLKYPTITFTDLSPNSSGSALFREAVPNPERTMRSQILEIVKKLHYNVDDNIRQFTKFTLTIEDYDGVAYKTGSDGVVNIVVSTRHIENVYNNNGRDKEAIKEEILGILSHEGTHGYQYEPKNAGGYDGSSDFYGFIEGVADAVRVSVGRHKSRSPRLGGNWTSGYTTSGFFIYWMMLEKDKNFLRKFQNSARVESAWSWDIATRSILGEGVQGLWNQYQDWIRSGAPGVPTALRGRELAHTGDIELHTCERNDSRASEHAALNLSVYPNPVSDKVLVSNPDAGDPIAAVKLFSVDGALVKEIDATSGEVNVADVLEGLYLLSAETESGARSTQRLSIQR